MTTTLVDDLRTARSRGVRPEAPDADLCGADLRWAYLRDARRASMPESPPMLHAPSRMSTR